MTSGHQSGDNPLGGVDVAAELIRDGLVADLDSASGCFVLNPLKDALVSDVHIGYRDSSRHCL
jgi:hypothetical protein